MAAGDITGTFVFTIPGELLPLAFIGGAADARAAKPGAAADAAAAATSRAASNHGARVGSPGRVTAGRRGRPA